MKHSFFYLTMLLGLVCWSMPEAGAKDDDKKLSRAEKRELKKQEKEAKKAAKKKGKTNADDEDDEDEEDDGKKKKKADKKAVSNAWKKLKPAFGKLKPNGKFFIYASYTTLTESGEAMLNQLIESEREFKAAKVNVLLINCEPVEEETACKLLKKMKCKLPMVMMDQKLEEEELPGFSPGSAPALTIVDATGAVKASGGPELLDTWHSVVGAKAPKRPKASKGDEEAGDGAGDSTEEDAAEE